ncbi:MAG: ComEC/Rec2 family competence protein [Streptosporangiaceae bacterium]
MSEPAQAAPEPGHDLRLVAPAAVVWLTSGVLLGCPVAAACVLAALAAVLALGTLTLTRQALAGVLLALTAAAATGTGLRVRAVESGPVRAAADHHVQTSLEVVLTSPPQLRARGVITLRARAEAIPAPDRAPLATNPTGAPVASGGGETDRGTEVARGWVRVRVPVLVIARGQEWRDLLPSQRVRIQGRVERSDHAELLAGVVLARGRPTVLDGPSRVQRLAAGMRRRLREAASVLPADQRGVLPGMVVGDTSGLDPGLAEQFKDAGLVHCMVVSGANLAILTLAVLWLARRVGLGNRRGPPVAAVVVLGFVLVAGLEPSVLRATVMGLIGLVAVWTGRERQGIPALATAVIVLVLADPGLARSYGFALSASATLGLLVLGPPWRDHLRRCGLPRRVAEMIAIATAAEVAVAPIVVLLSGKVSLVAIGANVLAEPGIALATVLGFATAVVALISMPAAQLLVRPAGWAVGWVIAVARTASAMPYANLPWKQGAAGAVLLLVLLLALCFALRRPWLRRLTAAAAVGLLLATVVVPMVAPGWPPRDWRFVVCDVGQGDGLVLFAGPRQAVVVDTGPVPALMDRCLDELGVREVPLLIITHPHLDHDGGLAGVSRGRHVGTLVPSPRTEDARPGVSPAEPGRRWTVGALTLEVLGPPPGAPVSPQDSGTTVNNASVVLVARWPGLSVLLAGDVEEQAQAGLEGLVPQVDVLKVPHHGSGRQLPGFLAAAHARISVISVGAHNDYGHPSARALQLLKGSRIYRTDRDGAVAVCVPGGGITVVARARRSP